MVSRASTDKDWQLNTTINIIETKLSGNIWLDDESDHCRFTVKINNTSSDSPKASGLEIKMASPQ